MLPGMAPTCKQKMLFNTFSNNYSKQKIKDHKYLFHNIFRIQILNWGTKSNIRNLKIFIYNPESVSAQEKNKDSLK
jgi:hypothetical protein